MRLAIVGTREPKISYFDWEKLLLSKINPSKVTRVISGGAKGVDTFAKLFAGRHHIPYTEFAPKYSEYGRYATLRRNAEIVREATDVIAFPSAESRGTHHTISEARRLGKRVIVVKI